MNSVIIYTTKYGSVEKAARMLKSHLSGEVDLIDLTKEKAPTLDQYDQVILGGSIYMGKIQSILSDYIRATLPLLLSKRIGLFICAGHPEEHLRVKELQEVFPAEIFNHAVAKEVFGHEYQLERLNTLHKFVMTKVIGITESRSEISEEVIERFAKRLNQCTSA